jgi:hypothetical protein
MRKQKSDYELLAPKMRQPIHITYLAKYILKKTIEETKEVLDRGVEEGLFEEVKFNGYYQLKTK